ncbi:MAG: Maf family nucleotide pyrophosphatase [Xanthobacteraceae bacterium]
MTMWIMDRPLILASQSRSRQTLLAAAGLTFEAMPAQLDERALQANSGLTDPSAIAALLARAKAMEVSEKNPDRIVIGADQTLALGEKLFSKPAGRAQAAEQLRQLAGATHQLCSAVAVVRNKEVLFETVSVARMTMRPLTADSIARYLDAAGPAVTTSVGAYQLEGIGVHLFERIDGDHFTILGLPLLPLLAFLRRAKLVAD